MELLVPASPVWVGEGHVDVDGVIATPGQEPHRTENLHHEHATSAGFAQHAGQAAIVNHQLPTSVSGYFDVAKQLVVVVSFVELWVFDCARDDNGVVGGLTGGVIPGPRELTGVGRGQPRFFSQKKVSDVVEDFVVCHRRTAVARAVGANVDTDVKVSN